MSTSKSFKADQGIVFTLIVGIIFGFLSACLVLTAVRDSSHFFSSRNSYLNDELQSEIEISPDTKVLFHGKDEEFHKGEDEIAQKMAEKVRILCLVLTFPENHQTKARHVKATWGKRCNILLFMSTQEDSSLPTVALPVTEGRDYLWGKTKEAFKYVYENYKDQADWFLKADDDTYVIVENLRYMLHPYSSSSPLYFGYRFKPFAKQGYMSGGAGYALSQASLRLLVQEGLPDAEKCQADELGDEDVEIGKCLENVGVKATDSRDTYGRERFLPLQLEYHIIPNLLESDSWFWNYTYYEAKSGLNCCSDIAVSFHSVDPYMMYVYEYLIYHLRPFGISPVEQNFENLKFGNELNVTET